MKEYRTLFTCLVSITVHIEVLDSIATDSFIMALRIVISRRGIRQSEMIMGAISQEERIY